MMLMLRRKTFHQPFFCHEFVQALNKSIANGVTMESETATLPKLVSDRRKVDENISFLATTSYQGN
jgi:hypothetical protein